MASGGSVAPTATTTYAVMGSNAAGNGNTASATVTVGAGPLTTVVALFVNASTSSNKTSKLRLINPTGSAGKVTATAFDESGKVLGTPNASLGNLAAHQTWTLSSANIEQLIDFTPEPTAKYAVYFYAGLSDVQLVNFSVDKAIGAKAVAQSQRIDRSATAAADNTYSAWFMSAAASSNKTNLLRLVNTGTQSGALSVSVYDETGNTVGTINTVLGTIVPRQCSL